MARDILSMAIGSHLKRVKAYYQRETCASLRLQEARLDLPGCALIGPPQRRAISHLEGALERRSEGGGDGDIAECIHEAAANLEMIENRILSRDTAYLSVASEANGLAKELRRMADHLLKLTLSASSLPTKET